MQNIKQMNSEAITMLHNSNILLQRSKQLMKLAEELRNDVTEKLKGVIQ